MVGDGLLGEGNPFPEHFQFEMLRISNHTACRFAGKASFSAHFWPDGAMPPPRISSFSKKLQAHGQRNAPTRQSPQYAAAFALQEEAAPGDTQYSRSSRNFFLRLQEFQPRGHTDRSFPQHLATLS